MNFSNKNILRVVLVSSTAILITTTNGFIYEKANNVSYTANTTIAGLAIEDSISFNNKEDSNKIFGSILATSTTYASSNVVNEVASTIDMNTITATGENIGYVPAGAETDSVIFNSASVDTESSTTENSSAVDNIEDYIDYSKFTNLGIANVTSALNVRKKASTSSTIVGKMTPKSGCTILSVEDGWAKIKSGDVKGYVKAEYLLTGVDALEKVKDYGNLVIIVDCDALRVREKASTDSKILTNIFKGEELVVLSSTDEWVKVEINNYTGYVAKEYVNFSFSLPKATAIETKTSSDSGSGSNGGNSSVRGSIVSTASKYLGNRYVYGGNSLTNGIDCSGFTQQIFAKYGYSLPRTSRAQANCGTAISASQAKAGDLVFYGTSSGINHVAICIGGGKIIHASNPRSGIKISNMYYTTPKKVVRIIKD